MARVLYVEDEEDDVFFMRACFRRAKLAELLHVVPDGQAAIDYLAGHRQFSDRQNYPLPDIVLLDLNLPGVSGFEVLQWIRIRGNVKGLPVIIFSSSARPEDRQRAAQLGATDYIEKPNSGLRFAEIVETLQRIPIIGRTEPMQFVEHLPNVDRSLLVPHQTG